MSIPKLEDLPLKPVPNGAWTRQWNKLMENSWLKQKLDRTRRLRDHLDYIRANAPEVTRCTGDIVIDLGPGAGELLEIAKHLGHEAVGFDAAITEVGGMGRDYLKACHLLHDRQMLWVKYGEMANWYTKGDARDKLINEFSYSCRLINSRGSIEQIFHDFMEGPPHDQHQDCMQLSWRLDKENIRAFRYFFEAINQMLVPSGILVIHANGSKNTVMADEAMKEAAAFAGLQLVRSTTRLHKWKRI